MSVQTKYRFGRSAFRTFEQGLEKVAFNKWDRRFCK